MKSAKLALALLMTPVAAGLCTLTGCGSEPPTAVEQKQMVNDSNMTLNDLEIADPSLKDGIKNAVGYAIFPNVGSGALGVKVASGNGEVYVQGGKYIGSAELNIVGGGLSVGGETYSEVLLFQTPEALSNFENNSLKFEANATAVALKAGATSSSKPNNGVIVLTHTKGGLMVDASLGGQQFTFKAANPQPVAAPSTQP